MSEVTLRVKRYDPGAGFRWVEYRVKVSRHDSVLDALIKVKWNIDQTLSIRYSCRMGICGSCGMVINGKPRLACETSVLGLGGGVVEVQPMYNFPLIKDLVVDMDDFFRKHRSIMPWLMRRSEEEQFKLDNYWAQSIDELNEYLPFTYCIKCGLCVSACPIVARKRDFLGPQALAAAYRWNADSRDQGSANRLRLVNSRNGVWSCEFLGSCSKVCPKGVEPSLAIQLLKFSIIRGRTR
jgi:succinate dehydrogenase / fumarate reductase iron-sulfur subunit